MSEFLARCRYLMIIPVIGCLFCSLVMVLLGTYKIFDSSVKLVTGGDSEVKFTKVAALEVIEIIDLFLVGTVAYITALGLYKLFISSTTFKMPMRLSIESLADLENKIIGVIVAALAVAFLGKATGTDDALTLMYFGIGVAVVVGGLALFVGLTAKKNEVKQGLQKSAATIAKDD